jgi:hypothetical protein
VSGGVFVSYRKNHNGVRRPHALTIAAIADRLRHHFGDDEVLIDMDLEAGDHYPSKLRGWLRDCEVMLVVVHREWLDDLKARRDEQWDWARWEVETALALGLHVLPVLLDDARLPGKEELVEAGFPGLAEIATRQYWRLGFAGWQRELAELLRMLEVRVATAGLPPAERPEPVRRKRFWVELTAAAVIGLVVPGLAIRIPVQDPEPPQIFLVVLAVFCCLLLAGQLAVIGFAYAVRGWLDREDKRFAERAHDTRTNVVVGLTISGLAVIVLFASRLLPDDAIFPAMALLAAGLAWPGHQWLHERRGDPWPYPHLVPSAPAVRGALAHVGRFLAERDLLTKAERDQVEFVLGQVEWARCRMAQAAGLTRRAWSRRPTILLPALHVFVLGLVIGSVVFAFVEGVTPRYGLYLVVIAAVAVLCHLATVELGFRHQRWRNRVVADAVPAEVDRLRAVLAGISIPPAAPQETAG